MAQNYLYMLEFAVQELIITQGNECAPPEYPLNAEFTFRTGVYVSIPEEDFGSVKDESTEEALMCPPPQLKKVTKNSDEKNGQCCLFALEKAVGEDENLMIHVYKKRTEKCKFLIGATEHKMKEMFDNVMVKFFDANEQLLTNGGKTNGIKSNITTGGLRLSAGGPSEQLEAAEGGVGDDIAEKQSSIASGQDRRSSQEAAGTVGKQISATISDKSKTKRQSNSGFIASLKQPQVPKKEIPVSEVKKMGMPLYNLEGKVTGSTVILIRLSCMGKCVTTSIPYPEKRQGAATQAVCQSDCRQMGSRVCAETCPARAQPCGYLGEAVCEDESSESEDDFLYQCKGHYTKNRK